MPKCDLYPAVALLVICLTGPYIPLEGYEFQCIKLALRSLANRISCQDKLLLDS
jgi:hypothetical protein